MQIKTAFASSIALASSLSAREGSIALADQAVVSALNFLTGVIIGRTCAKEQFGLYMLGFSMVFFVINLQQSLILSAYTVYSQRLKTNAHTTYAGSTLIHQLVFSTVTMVVLIVIGTLLYFGIGPQELRPVVWSLLCVISFILFREYIRRICFANLKMLTVLLLDSLITVTQLSLLLIFANVGILNASKAFWATGIACGVISVGWLICYSREFTPRRAFIMRDLKKNLAFGKWIFGAKIAYFLGNQIYPWVLAACYGTAATGVFAASWGVASLANPIVLGLTNSLGPVTARAYVKGINEVRSVVIKNTILLAATLSLFCLSIILYGDHIIVLIYGNKYSGSASVLLVLALGFLASAIGVAPASGLAAIDRPDANFKANLIALGVTLTIGILLVRAFGTIGAALALLAINVIESGMKLGVFLKIARPSGTRGSCDE
jgi:O-antigen/teichoic acid export membrane protein